MTQRARSSAPPRTPISRPGIVTASKDETARLWDALTGKPIGEPLGGHQGPVFTASFSPDGSRIVTASADETARLWDSETRLPIGVVFRGYQKRNDYIAAFSPDGRRTGLGGCDRAAEL